MEPELQSSPKPSRARKSSPSRKKVKPALNVRHMLYASALSGLLTYSLATGSDGLTALRAMCSILPSGGTTLYSTP